MDEMSHGSFSDAVNISEILLAMCYDFVMKAVEPNILPYTYQSPGPI